MTELSPFVRKFAALTLLAFLVMGSIELIAWPLLSGAWQNVDELRALRLERAQLEQTDARPMLKAGDAVPANLYLHTTSSALAMNQLTSLVNNAARSSKLAINQINAVPDDAAQPRIVALDVRLAGKEEDVIGFLNRLEGGEPLIRLSQWSLSATDPAHDQVQFVGRLSAAWGQP